MRTSEKSGPSLYQNAPMLPYAKGLVFNDNGECQDIAMNSQSEEKEPFAPAKAPGSQIPHNHSQDTKTNHRNR